MTNEDQVKQSLETVYSKTVFECVTNPKNIGAIDGANGFASVIGPYGDRMEMWLKVDGNTIIKIGFMSNGCGTDIASGSMITEMAKGKSLAEAHSISQKDVLDALDGLPEGSEHCALLASNTLKAAIRDYMEMQKEP